MKIYILVFVLLLFMNCQTEKSARIVVEKFPIEKEVFLNKIEIEPVLYYVGDMLIVDSILVTLDMKNDVFFQRFNLPELTYLGGTVNRGDGPEDEIAILPNLYNIGKTGFSYRSIQEIKYAFIKDRNIVVDQELRLPDKYMNIINTFVMDGAVYGYDMLGESEKEFVKYDPVKETITEFGADYPSVNMNVDKSKRNVIFSKAMSAREDGKMFAVLYDKFPIMRIYDHTGKVICETEYKNNQRTPIAYTYNEMQVEGFNDLTINYQGLKVTDRYIYGLYSGKTHGELQTTEKRVDDYCKEVHVWDWTGKGVARYVLDIPVSSFAVSPDDSYLLFYSFQDESLLYKLDMHLSK